MIAAASILQLRWSWPRQLRLALQGCACPLARWPADPALPRRALPVARAFLPPAKRRAFRLALGELAPKLAKGVVKGAEARLAGGGAGERAAPRNFARARGWLRRQPLPLPAARLLAVVAVRSKQARSARAEREGLAGGPRALALVAAAPRLRRRSGALSAQSQRGGGRATRARASRGALRAARARAAESKRGERGWRSDF